MSEFGIWYSHPAMGECSRGRVCHYVPTPIGTRSVTATTVRIFERVRMEAGN